MIGSNLEREDIVPYFDLDASAVDMSNANLVRDNSDLALMAAMLLLAPHVHLGAETAQLLAEHPDHQHK